ncbi:MAG: motility associated factor glycosyltransferase family protein [Magnetospirillum sp.]|nr:motility associated factor glycosyltransferase family protein [Magnetospirillum sp.]
MSDIDGADASPDTVPDADRRAFFNANLECIRQISPAIAQQLGKHTPQSTLVKGPDGDWDIQFRTEFLYGANGRQRLDKDLAQARSGHGHRLHIAPMSTSNLEYFSGRVLYKSLKRTTEAGITFYERPINQTAYHLISFGFGLGYHMPDLLEITKPFSVCIVEPNIDFLYHSLFVYDWSALARLNQKYGAGCVGIYTVQTADAIATTVRSHCRGISPVSVDGTLLFYSYPNDQMTAGAAMVIRDAYLISIGLGFVHDEMEMARAAYKNMRDGDIKLFRNGSRLLDYPVFIIGSGPSIDDDLEVIKANQDRAIIIACGTSGRVLLANGIQPDFQVILENGTNPYLALAGAHEQYGFEKAALIASNTVDPRLKSMFKNSIFFLRQAICSYALFFMGPEYQMENPGPTVVNTGLSAALSMGFREFYLFGVDLGTRTKGRHHSRHSVYRHDDDQKEGVKGAFDYTDDYPIVDVANFGGVVHTDLFMTWTRDIIVKTLYPFGAQCFVHNCSDGLSIPNTIPMSSSAIKLKSKKELKDQFVKAAMDSFPDANRDQIQKMWTRADWPAEVCGLIQKVVDLIADMPEDLAGLMHQVKTLLLVDALRRPTFPEFFIRGSILISVMTVEYYWRRIETPENRLIFREIAKEELTDALSQGVGR